MKILVTGGTGYIGSHTCVELLTEGYEVVIVDNLYNSSEKVIERINEITGKDVIFYKTDIRNYDAMNSIFLKEKPDAVIHFAGLKSVGESVSKPLEYYENNICGTLNLCKVMRENACNNIIFPHLRPYMVNRNLFRLLKSVQRGYALIRMVGQNICLNRF